MHDTAFTAAEALSRPSRRIEYEQGPVRRFRGDRDEPTSRDQRVLSQHRISPSSIPQSPSHVLLLLRLYSPTVSTQFANNGAISISRHAEKPAKYHQDSNQTRYIPESSHLEAFTVEAQPGTPDALPVSVR